MATLVANSSGEVTGKFTIPAGIPAGAKAVKAVGAAGQAGVATYTGRGIIRTEERRAVTTLTEGTAFRGSDPLAQTFTLGESRHIAGVDLWFTVKGTHDIIVQVRDTSNGVPSQVVLAEARVAPGPLSITTSTQILFNTPVWLEAGREFALVVLTDDANASLAVAELGKFDAANQKWITSQPYQVGVLLSSSNASTWTAHQDKDLAFRLLACHFTATTRSVDLGTVSVTDTSDFLAALNIDIPATGTSAEILAAAPSGEVYRMAPDNPIALPSRVTGTVALSLSLAGSATASPVAFPGMQLVAGDQQDTGTYVSRAFPVGTSSRVSITFDAKLPGTSSVLVEIQRADLSWQTIALSSGSDVGDGWVERVHTVTGFTAPTSRVRITLSGSAQHRPRVRKLRAVATA